MAGSFGSSEDHKPPADLPSFTEFTSSLRTAADYFDNVRRLSSATVQSEGYGYWPAQVTRADLHIPASFPAHHHQQHPHGLYPERLSPPNQMFTQTTNEKHELNHTCPLSSHVTLENNPFLSGKTQFPSYTQSAFPGHHLPDSPLCVPGSNPDTPPHPDHQNLSEQQLHREHHDVTTPQLHSRCSQSRPLANDWTVGGEVGQEFWTKELCSLFDAMPSEPEVLQTSSQVHNHNSKLADYADSIYTSNGGYPDAIYSSHRGFSDAVYTSNLRCSSTSALNATYLNAHYSHANSVQSRDVKPTLSADMYAWYDYKPPLMTSDFSLDSDIESCGVTSTTDHHDESLLRFPVLSNEKASFDHVSSTSESGAESDAPNARLDSDDIDVKENFMIPKEARRAADEPRRPKNSFIRFSVENRRRISKEHPLMDNREISKILGGLWKTLTPEQKKPYEMEFSKDMETIRTENPDWQYIPTNRLAADLVEPMPRRLRPRNCLKKKLYNAPKVYQKRQTTKQVRTARSACGKRHAPSFTKTPSSRFTRVKQMGQPQQTQPSATAQSQAVGVQEQQTWVQCDVCYKWRRLPNPVLPSQLPDIWLCELNPDRHHKSCFIPEEF